MKNEALTFNEQETLQALKKYLPAQAPLKDFIFQNNLEAFLDADFFKGLNKASEIFGYKVYLSLAEFRALYKNNKINDTVLDKIIINKKGFDYLNEWKEKVINKQYENISIPRIKQLRANWKKEYKIDLDSLVHPILFRIVCSYLDQGISVWNFPVWQNGFLASVKELEENSFTSFFKTKRARNLLLKGDCSLANLLKIIIGEESLYKHYLFDQQFGHQGWSGMVAAIENNPKSLIDIRKITLEDFITLELLLEIDALDMQFGVNIWSPLGIRLNEKPIELFSAINETEIDEVSAIWQEAYEWTYYDEVLAGLLNKKKSLNNTSSSSFQAMFCIDDREISLRDYLEKIDTKCETFGTPGFFNVEFYFQPEQGNFYTKLCPAPVTPKYLIKELGTTEKRKKDIHFTKEANTLFGGWFISQTLGFESAFRLIFNIFRPTMTTAAASSFKHMNKASALTIVNTDLTQRENELQIGFTIDEMVQRVHDLLKSIALVNDFAPIVYVIGHGASTVNNPFYATMDCGACSCRPGSVNARVLSFMANNKEVRVKLAEKGIVIPNETIFIGGLHDTTRDDIQFFDENGLSKLQEELHGKNQKTFETALDLNSKERSRRFESINTKSNPKKIHEKVRTRSVSIFEPRPELDHATVALTIIGRRELTKGLFLDRRSFLNSYDFSTDLDGALLFNIMKPIAPVCGGINLSYYFARVDNQKLGAGTKLPHNVMGLFGISNGIDGDLRPGLPSQMIEAHDPIRLLVIVEHFPEIVLETIKKLPNYDWYKNQWFRLVVMNPVTKEYFEFTNEQFIPYVILQKNTKTITDLNLVVEQSNSLENLPVYLIA